MKSFLLVFLAIFSIAFALESLGSAPNGLFKLPKEAFYNFTEYVSALNYPHEVHQISTKDGYRLTFFRIQAKNTQIKSGLPVVFVNHGLLDSCDSMVINEEEHAPALILANKGFDVWLGNNRGNKYSLDHSDRINFDPSDFNSGFWDFSWQEMADHDLPAGFEYIAEKTGQLVNYMGHSEGSTIMFAALASRNPQVLKHLGKFIALAPAVFVQHSKSPLVVLAGSLRGGVVLKELEFLLKKKRFGFPSDLARTNWVSICTYARPVCIAKVRLLSDTHPSVDNTKRLPITTGHYPAGSSVQNILYWQQMFASPHFRKYDYRKAKNLQIYGTPYAPDYDLSQIKEPVYMFVGKYDELASIKDTATLKGKLTGSSNVQYNVYPLGHSSFLWGKDVMSYMKDVIAVLNS